MSDERSYRGWDAQSEPEPGDGPLDSDTIEQDADSYSHYGSSAATQIGEQNDDHDRLRELNEGRHPSDGELPTRQARWDKKRTTEILCSQLELTEPQTSAVVDAMETLDFSQFGSQGRIETVALGLIRYVVNKDRLERDPEATWISHENRFKQLMDDCDVTMSDLTTVKKVALDQIPNLQAGVSSSNRDPNLPQTSAADRPDEWWEEHLVHYEDMDEDRWEQVPDAFVEAIPEQHRDRVPDSRLDE